MTPGESQTMKLLPDTVSTWMGDPLQRGKLSLQVTNSTGQLSLAIPS